MSRLSLSMVKRNVKMTRVALQVGTGKLRKLKECLIPI